MAEEFTVEQLAQRTGMSVRNIREWQALGLLPPPARRGRVGMYGVDHIARVRRIQKLKTDGFRLDLIRRILDADPDAQDADVERMAVTVLEPFTVEEPLALTEAELAARLGRRTELPAELSEIGLIRRLPDGRVEVRSPRLLTALERLAAQGLDLAGLLLPLTDIARHNEAIAHTLVEIYREQVWEPFLKSGMPAAGWSELSDSVVRLRPLMYDVVLTTLRLALDTVTDQALMDNAARLPPEMR
ncbi:MerR family transcriptional regulator [Actinomadura verrucosospora]|uniref:MerR family transcriptional regulator n=1 Tax=Actinomadura verrucosospora TaxID=46165 RepID=A0A7D3VS01_ACTVE|nr:MerR family transcriptional regulator [Actinomadura verrucosospora]QKG18716.1 MerR family transcriptional regulator [Actinomadura verrucosospora]